MTCKSEMDFRHKACIPGTLLGSYVEYVAHINFAPSPSPFRHSREWLNEMTFHRLRSIALETYRESDSF